MKIYISLWLLTCSKRVGAFPLKSYFYLLNKNKSDACCLKKRIETQKYYSLKLINMLIYPKVIDTDRKWTTQETQKQG